MKLIRLDDFRAKEVIDALEALLQLARVGELRGIQYAADLRGMQRPSTGMLGSYKRDTAHALTALTMAKAKLMDKIASEDQPRFGESK